MRGAVAFEMPEEGIVPWYDLFQCRQQVMADIRVGIFIDSQSGGSVPAKNMADAGFESLWD